MKVPLQLGGRIDGSYLRSKFPDAAELEKHGHTWDEIGAFMTRRATRAGSRQSAERQHVGPGTRKTRDDWEGVQEALRQLLGSDHPELVEIRKRIHDSATITTPHLLATLSLWLAGFLGKPVTLITPLAAIALLQIEREAGEGQREIASR